MRKIDRFLEYLNYKGITKNKATIECGLAQGLLHQAESGKSDLGYKTIGKILIKYQDLDKDWLMTGQGDMLKNNTIIQQIGDKSNNNMQVVGTSEIALLQEKVKYLESLVEEKERTIKILLDKR